MLCPYLSSVGISFWLLVVCIYNTFFSFFNCSLWSLFRSSLGTFDIIQRRELSLGIAL